MAPAEAQPGTGHRAGNGLGRTRPGLAKRAAVGNRRRAHHIHVAGGSGRLQMGRHIRRDHSRTACPLPQCDQHSPAAILRKVHAHRLVQCLQRHAAERAGADGHPHHPIAPLPRQIRADAAGGLCVAGKPGGRVLRRTGIGPDRTDNRRRGAQRNPRPVAVLDQRGTGIHHPGSPCADALRRRNATHPAGRADRLRTGGSAIRAG